MTVYKTWDEYLASEQDAYLDEDNVADCDVRETVGGYTVFGQTNLGAYEVMRDGYTVGIYVSGFTSADMQMEEVVNALQSEEG